MANHPSKEDILKAAQNNGIKGMEYENRVGTKSSLLGFLVALVVGTCLFLAEFYVKKKWNFALAAVLFTAAGVQMLYEGIRIKSVWRIILGAVQILLAIIFVLAFIGQVIK